MFFQNLYKLLFLLTSCTFFACSKATRNYPVDGSKIGANEPYKYKVYPFKNTNGLEGRNENFGEVDYELLEKTEDLKFNLNKEIAIKYMENYFNIIENYEEGGLKNYGRKLDKYDLERFQDAGYIAGNGKILKNLKDSVNKMSIPVYIVSYFDELQKYINIKKKKEEQMKLEAVIEDDKYWQSTYRMDEAEKKLKFQEKDFNYYRYLKSTNGD